MTKGSKEKLGPGLPAERPREVRPFTANHGTYSNLMPTGGVLNVETFDRIWSDLQKEHAAPRLGFANPRVVGPREAEAIRAASSVPAHVIQIPRALLAPWSPR